MGDCQSSVSISTDPRQFRTKKYYKFNKDFNPIIEKINQNQTLTMYGPYRKQFFDYIFNNICNYYLNSQEKVHFLSIINGFIQEAFQSLEQDNKKDDDKKQNQLKSDYSFLLNKLYFKQLQCLKYAKIMCRNDSIKGFGYETTFLNFNFDLSLQDDVTKKNKLTKLQKQLQKNQLLYIAQKTYQYCKDDFRSFAFLSLYLIKSIQKLFDNSSIDVLKAIDQRLQDQMNKLAKTYPQIQINSIQNKKQFYQELNVKKLQHNQKVQFNNSDSHFNQLKNYILKKSDIAKQELNNFNQLVKDCCIENGYGFISGVKIKDRTAQKSIWRTIQKLLEKPFEKQFKEFKQSKCWTEFYENHKSLNKTNLKQFVRWEKTQIQHNIINMIQKSNSVKFDAKDLIRGKCIFTTIAQVVDTVKKIKAKVSSTNQCSILQIKNELKNKNMVKIIIKLRQSVAQLQLVLKLDKITNQFNHKLYEINRSVIYTNVTNLFLLHEQWAALFFTDIKNNLDFITKNNIVLKQKNANLEEGIQVKQAQVQPVNNKTLKQQIQGFFSAFFTQEQLQKLILGNQTQLVHKQSLKKSQEEVINSLIKLQQKKSQFAKAQKSPQDRINRIINQFDFFVINEYNQQAISRFQQLNKNHLDYLNKKQNVQTYIQIQNKAVCLWRYQSMGKSSRNVLKGSCYLCQIIWIKQFRKRNSLQQYGIGFEFTKQKIRSSIEILKIIINQYRYSWS